MYCFKTNVYNVCIKAIKRIWSLVEPNVSNYVFRVCVLDLQTISAMYALGSWLVPSDEIRLYANDMQRSYTVYGTECRIEHTEAPGIYSLVSNLICAEYEFETFGSTSDQIRLMALIQTL